MNTCRHLRAFKISVETVDPSHAGLPPWGAVCEDCASTVVKSLRFIREQIKAKQHSGKSAAAVNSARAGRVLDDWCGWQQQWQPDDPVAVEAFRSKLGADYFNHGGLLRVRAKDGTFNEQFNPQLHELRAGDWLIIDADGNRRISKADATS